LVLVLVLVLVVFLDLVLALVSQLPAGSIAPHSAHSHQLGCAKPLIFLVASKP